MTVFYYTYTKNADGTYIQNGTYRATGSEGYDPKAIAWEDSWSKAFTIDSIEIISATCNGQMVE